MYACMYNSFSCRLFDALSANVPVCLSALNNTCVRTSMVHGLALYAYICVCIMNVCGYREAMEEYYSLMTAMHLPSCSPVGVEPCNPARAGQGAAAAERHQPLVPQYTHGAPLVEVDEAAEEDEVDEAAEEEMRLHVPRLDVPHHLSASELSLLDDAVHTLILVSRSLLLLHLLLSPFRSLACSCMHARSRTHALFLALSFLLSLALSRCICTHAHTPRND